MTQEVKPKKGLNITLWVLQVLLAVLYANAGFMKAFKPITEIAPMITWAATIPEPLVRFIGFSELLGAIGLILPAALKIVPRLSVFAAIGIAMVMFLATAFHISRGEFMYIPITVILFSLAAFISYGRLKLVPFAQKG